MLRRIEHLTQILVLIALPLLTGCFSMELTPLEPPTGLDKLIDISDSTIPVQVHTNGLHERTLGHQYLMLALPLTRIYQPSLSSDAAMELSVACGMRGYHCSTNTQLGSKRRLSVELLDVTINGYDLLVVRKPTASVTMSAQLFEDNRVVRSCEESTTATNTAHYAFNAELQHAIGEALLQNSYKLLDCLGVLNPS